MDKIKKDKLFTGDYMCIMAANFLLYFGFFLLLPIIPFYLAETFGADKAVIGVVLSIYTVASLFMRSCSGYLVDTFARKPLYLFAYFTFTAMFFGYIVAFTLTMFAILRFVHGLAFGLVTVSGSTIAIDIMPSSRRGEGIGYFGLTGNIAMSIGPMCGLFMHDHGHSFVVIFASALVSCLLGFILASLVRTRPKPKVEKQVISLDRFFLLKGVNGSISLLLLAVPYGITTSYIAMYFLQMGISGNGGLYFTLMALGMAVTRLFSGKRVDKGFVTETIKVGLWPALACFALLAADGYVADVDKGAATALFYTAAVLHGIGFGIIFPAYNSLFINLGRNNQRGTANSTYLTSWDVGIGIGVFSGGYIAEYFSFEVTYMFGCMLVLIAIAFFYLRVTPHYKKYKLR